MNALKEKLFKLIAVQGPVTLGQYMQFALSEPEHGYYMRADPLGRAGDFITAPEVSQMFGELIGLFFVQAWRDRKSPAPFILAELGPGRGTLMADMMRAAAQVEPGFGAAARIVLIETSPVLRAVQKRTLGHLSVQWVDNLEAVATDAPFFVVANEFFDALPIRQFVKSERGWHERMVTTQKDMLRLITTPEPVPVPFIPARLRGADRGAVFELNDQAEAFARDIARRIGRKGGAALIVDYGYTKTALGDTFQAVQDHRYADPLAEPGDADLTAHVDFARLAETAREEGADVFGPIAQGQFLEALGIGVRAQRLKDTAIDRLTAPEKMGTLFKVLAFAQAGSPPLPGFPC